VLRFGHGGCAGEKRLPKLIVGIHGATKDCCFRAYIKASGFLATVPRDSSRKQKVFFVPTKKWAQWVRKQKAFFVPIKKWVR
jgi:hypothetical protein